MVEIKYYYVWSGTRTEVGDDFEEAKRAAYVACSLRIEKTEDGTTTKVWTRSMGSTDWYLQS